MGRGPRGWGVRDRNVEPNVWGWALDGWGVLGLEGKGGGGGAGATGIEPETTV
jgi:hypothetical protein